MNSIILNFFTDAGLVLKIAFIIFIVVFVKQRITKNWLAISAIVLICVVLIFFYWPIFGSMYVLYVLISIGVGSVLVDTFFVTMGEGQKGGSPDPQEMLKGGRHKEPDLGELHDMYEDRAMVNSMGRRKQ